MSVSALADLATQTWVGLNTEADPSVPLKNGFFAPTNSTSTTIPVGGMTSTGVAMATIIKMGSGDIGAGTRLSGTSCTNGAIVVNIVNTAGTSNTWTDYANARISYMVLKYA